MSDWFHSLVKFLDYNRGVVLGLLITIALAGWLVGCDVTTTSIFNPEAKVTAIQLQNEISNFKSDMLAKEALIETALDDLEQKTNLRKQVIETIGGLGVGLASGTVTPAGAISSVVSLLLLGATGGLTLDVVRKNRVIASQKAS